MRLLFCDPQARTRLEDWESSVRFVVATFRSATARSGASKSAGALVDELSRSSPDFRAIWHDQDVRPYGEGVKHLHNSTVGTISLEYSAFAVDGYPDLGLVIYAPATPADADRIRSLVRDKT